MSEEEIRKILLCENVGELAIIGLLDLLNEQNNYDLNELKKQATKDLLNLYNEEKEKNIRLTKDNLDLDRLYRRAGNHLIDIGKTELGEYLLAQIGAIPTWSDFDDYCNWIDKEKLKEIIYPSPENPISLEIQNSEMYKKLENLLK